MTRDRPSASAATAWPLRRRDARRTRARLGRPVPPFSLTPWAVAEPLFARCGWAVRQGKEVVQVACGAAHCVAVESDGTIYTWGCGDYGRLGHREQKSL